MNPEPTIVLSQQDMDQHLGHFIQILPSSTNTLELYCTRCKCTLGTEVLPASPPEPVQPPPPPEPLRPADSLFAYLSRAY